MTTKIDVISVVAEMVSVTWETRHIHTYTVHTYTQIAIAPKIVRTNLRRWKCLQVDCCRAVVQQ